MSQIDLGKALLEAFTQPSVVKIFLFLIFLTFALVFLRSLIDRVSKRLDAKYKNVRKLTDHELILLILFFFAVTICIWKLM